MLEIECMPGQVFIFHGEELRAPDFGTPEETMAFALRRVCHMLVDRIDDAGLQEVCQSLAEFYQYYKPADTTAHQLRETHTRDATLTTRSVSPAFVIQEE